MARALVMAVAGRGRAGRAAEGAGMRRGSSWGIAPRGNSERVRRLVLKVSLGGYVG